jgi:hypothetical protein
VGDDIKFIFILRKDLVLLVTDPYLINGMNEGEVIFSLFNKKELQISNVTNVECLCDLNKFVECLI